MTLKKQLSALALIGSTLLSPMGFAADSPQPTQSSEKIEHVTSQDFDTLYNQLTLQRRQTPEESKNLRYLFQEFYQMHQGPERMRALIQTGCHIGYVDKSGQNDVPEPSGGYLSQSKGLHGTSYELVLNPKKPIETQLSTLVHESVHLQQHLHMEAIQYPGDHTLTPLAYAAKTLAGEMDADVSSIETIYKQKDKYAATWVAFDKDLPHAKQAYEQAKAIGLSDDAAYTKACQASVKDYDATQKRLFGYGLQQALSDGYKMYYESSEPAGKTSANKMMEMMSKGRYQGSFEADLEPYKPTGQHLKTLQQQLQKEGIQTQRLSVSLLPVLQEKKMQR